MIGPIDRVKDFGVGWRRQIIQECNEKMQLGINFLDPTNKLSGMISEDQHEVERINKMKLQARWADLSNFMRTVVAQDYRGVELSDFVICYIDETTHMCGSYFELQKALTENKPYFLISPNGRAKLPTWLFGICDYLQVFDNVENVVDRLVQLNNGTVPLSEKWVFANKQVKIFE